MTAELLNTRETAIAIWLSIGLITLLYGKSTRESFGGVIKAFFAWKIFSWWLAMVGYIAACVYVFYKLGLWEPELLKETVFYILFSASVSLFRANHISEEKYFFRELLKENLKLGILVEFVTGLYPFGLWKELLIVPIVILLAGMQAVGGKDEKNKPAMRLINWIWLVGFAIVFYHVINAVTLHFKELLSLDNLRKILLAPNLTLAFIPFLYLLSLRMVYETQFVLLGFKVENEKLKKFSRIKAMLSFRTDLDGLKRWVNRWNLMRPQTEEEVLKTIADLKAQQKIEKSPPNVPPNMGWSPYIAKDFLPDEKLKAGYYDPGFEEQWSARSGTLTFAEDWSGNNITYQIRGNNFAATQLELRMVAFDPKQATDLHQLFCKHIVLLYTAAANSVFPNDVISKIAKKQTVKYQTGRYIARLRKEKWQNITHSYDLTFTITIAKHV